MLEYFIKKLLSPPISRKWFWKKWYNYLARRKPGLDIKLMNYGYSDKDYHPTLDNIDEPDRYPIQLYHYVATQVSLTGKKFLRLVQVGVVVLHTLHAIYTLKIWLGSIYQNMP